MTASNDCSIQPRSSSEIVSEGKSLIVWSPCPATCVSSLWSLNNGITINWQNSPLRAVSSGFQDALSPGERGDPNSTPIISPLPRTDLISSWRPDISSNASSDRLPSCADLSISRSDSITCNVASPAAMELECCRAMSSRGLVGQGHTLKQDHIDGAAFARPSDHGRRLEALTQQSTARKTKGMALAWDIRSPSLLVSLSCYVSNQAMRIEASRF